MLPWDAGRRRPLSVGRAPLCGCMGACCRRHRHGVRLRTGMAGGEVVLGVACVEESGVGVQRGRAHTAVSRGGRAALVREEGLLLNQKGGRQSPAFVLGAALRRP